MILYISITTAGRQICLEQTSSPQKPRIMPSASELRQTAEQPLNPAVPQTYEARERQQQEQPANDNRPAEATNAPLNEDYEPNPAASLTLSPERQHIVDSVLRLYSGSGKNDEGATGDKDIRIYAKKAVYDDIASCKLLNR